MMVRAATVALEAVTNRKFTKNMQKKKGEGIMRIAVTYENGQIFQHFGHTETFKIYDVEEVKNSTFRNSRYEWKRTWRIGRSS